MALVIVMRVTASTIVVPITTGVGRDAWIASLFATVATIPLGWLLVNLALMHPGKTIVQCSQDLLGRLFGTLISLLYICFFGFIAASVARELGESYALSVMPKTPLLVFIISGVLLASVSARNGIEVIGRMSETVLFLSSFFVVLTLALPYARMDFRHLLPVLENGIRPAVKASLVPFALFGEVISVGMVMPYLDRPGRAAKYLIYAIVLSGAFVVAEAITIIATLGPTADMYAIPFFKQARLISIGDFLERLEVLPLAAWTFMVWLKTAFLLWVVVLGLSQTFGLSDYRPLVYPVGFVVASLAPLLYENVFELQELLTPKAWGFLASAVEVGIVVLLFALSLLRMGFKTQRQRDDSSRRT